MKRSIKKSVVWGEAMVEPVSDGAISAIDFGVQNGGIHRRGIRMISQPGLNYFVNLPILPPYSLCVSRFALSVYLRRTFQLVLVHQTLYSYRVVDGRPAFSQQVTPSGDTSLDNSPFIAITADSTSVGISRSIYRTKFDHFFRT